VLDDISFADAAIRPPALVEARHPDRPPAYANDFLRALPSHGR
jgi:hypothetical protein